MSENQSTEVQEQIREAYRELMTIRNKISDLRSSAEPQSVSDYALADRDGKDVMLSELFGDKSDLIVVHNMGQGCRYCTLWADGFNGVYKHLEDRAGFVVVSADPPEKMRNFAESRNWHFRIVSNNDSPFTRDMGYEVDGKPQPGVSTFRRDSDGSIARIANAPFGPGDEFCAVWHLFDMLADGPDGWEPQYAYK
jgi:predicted dithiol-disulfide oxidoreductase (DUF899 family)